MTHTWPADPPGHPTPRAVDWPIVLLAASIIALVLYNTPGALAAIDPLAGDLCVSLGVLWLVYGAFSLLVSGMERGWALWRLRRSLAEGQEDLRLVAEGLRGLDVGRGRARLCRDVAVRCLEGAGRFRRLEAVMRREAAGWMREMKEEMK